MDKKTIIIGVSWLAFGALALKYKYLVHEFKSVHNELKEKEEMFKKAYKIATNALFTDLASRFDD